MSGTDPAAADAAARKAATIGAQVVLDPTSDAAIAVKGGMGATVEENTVARNKALAEMGHDPNDPQAQQIDHTPDTQQAAADVFLEGATEPPPADTVTGGAGNDTTTGGTGP